MENMAIAGLSLVSHKFHEDDRGSLTRLFEAEMLADLGIFFEPVHVNLARIANSGTVKGLHFQLQPVAEVKIVTCIAGRIFDVAVDLRLGSQSYGQWFGIELSADKPEGLLIPQGCAHGMQSLEPNTIVHYTHSAAYTPRSESGVHPLDPDIAVAWPLPAMYLSDRDWSLPWLANLGEVSQ